MLMRLVVEAQAADEQPNASPTILPDALAMACRFLPDAQLGALMSSLVSKSVAAGSIGALPLTGLGLDALPLLQAYLDRTADVQSVALLSARGSAALARHPRAQRWLAVYRDLLNRWQAWHTRCSLDIAVTARLRLLSPAAAAPAGVPTVPASRSYEGLPGTAPQAAIEPAAQVFARCTFCSHSLVTGGLRARSVPGGKAGPALGAAGKQRGAGHPSACPRCKKPLPRCSVCHQHLGCPDPTEPLQPAQPARSKVAGRGAPGSRLIAGRLGAAATAPPSDGQPWDAVSSGFGHWMVWCQSCKHGGHAAHLMEWFEHQSECPVAGCSCRCADLDQSLRRLGGDRSRSRGRDE
jgi:hypothetical protein